jgi:hypothetical protein
VLRYTLGACLVLLLFPNDLCYHHNLVQSVRQDYAVLSSCCCKISEDEVETEVKTELIEITLIQSAHQLEKLDLEQVKILDASTRPEG